MGGARLAMQLFEPRAWSPEDPFLYDLELIVRSETGDAIDRVESYFAVRDVGVAPDDEGVPLLKSQR